MEGFSLRQLRYFVAVAEELHFGRAAERVKIAQPPLTQQIQKLEALIGYRLFRRGRRTELTEAGAALLQEARFILPQVEHAVERSRRAGRGQTGELRLGAPPSIMLSALPAAIRKYRERFPEVQFTLRELSTSAIEEALGRGEIDLGFLRETRPAPPLVSKVLFDEPLVAVLPATHPLAARQTLAVGALRAEPFVFFPRRLGGAFYDRLVSFCAEAGFVPRIVQEATQWQSVVCLVEAGLGVSLAPGCVQRFRWKAVVYRPLRGLRTVVSACWRADRESSTASEFRRLAELEFRHSASTG